MTNILVTGGAGYIGSHTCKELYKKGFTPVVLDNLSTGHAEFVKWGPFMLGDLQDKDHIRIAFDKYQPQAVVHFAASAYVGESVVNPEKYYSNNVIGSLNLLKVMHEEKCYNLVFSSSCATYGLPKSTPITIDHMQKPINPYGTSKLIVEKVICDYINAYQLSATILRYFNAAGADIDGDIGERHDPETHLIPNAINASLNSKKHLEIYGTDYNTSDGTCIRDYVHVTDLAEAHVLSLKKMFNQDDTNQSKQHIFNLGSEKGFSVYEIVSAVESITGAKINIKKRPRRAGDPSILVADNTEARTKLNWVPKYSSLKTIINSAHQWALSEER